MSSTQKPILIAGAGLASLLLAQSLLRSGIPFLIFERDASFTTRSQGYRLRLSSEGLDAIESVLGPKDFQTFWEKCGKTGVKGGLGVIDAITGQEIVSPEEDKMGDGVKREATRESLTSRDGRVVGISRGDMRTIFMTGCEPYISWSHHVTGYELTPTGVQALFANGTKSIEGEMLIGGEGIYSKTAKKLSKGLLKVFDTGARGIHGQAPSTAFKGLGEGVWRIVDSTNPVGKTFIITNVRPGELDDPSINFGWTMGGQPGVIKAPNDDYSITGSPAAAIAKEFTKNWHPRVKPLFDQMIESEAAFWKITCSTPTGVPEWENEKRVTLIGDAVHSMTPAGGIGANTAVRDSALLGRLIGEVGGVIKEEEGEGDGKEGVTERYEKEMRVYGSEAVRTSYGMAKVGFGVLIDGDSGTV